MSRPGEIGEQKVTDAWSLRLETVLAGGGNIILAEVDGQGSEGQGEAWQRMLEGGVGEVDVRDQVSALHWVMERYQVDRARVGVMGANYGGYLGVKMVTDTRHGGGEPVTCALVRSPVTDWRAQGEEDMASSASSDTQSSTCRHFPN